jgi:hypothetical protein
MFNAPIFVIALLLLVGIVLVHYAGRRVLGWQRKGDAAPTAGLGPMTSAVLGLFSLLLAFTFNRSASHYYHMRERTVEEINAIGTGLLRADLFADSDRTAFRADMKAYVEARIAYYDAGTDEQRISSAMHLTDQVAMRLWARAARLSRTSSETVRSMQMIPAIGGMMDATAQREEARTAHLPGSVLAGLFALCLVGSFLLGYAGHPVRTDRVVIGIYAITTVLTIGLILDLDRPRSGMINNAAVHAGMEQLLHLADGAE